MNRKRGILTSSSECLGRGSRRLVVRRETCGSSRHVQYITEEGDFSKFDFLCSVNEINAPGKCYVFENDSPASVAVLGSI